MRACMARQLQALARPTPKPQLLRVGQRLLRCMAKFFASDGRLAAAGNAALLCRAMKQRVWEDSPQQVRGSGG